MPCSFCDNKQHYFFLYQMTESVWKIKFTVKNLTQYILAGKCEFISVGDVTMLSLCSTDRQNEFDRSSFQMIKQPRRKLSRTVSKTLLKYLPHFSAKTNYSIFGGHILLWFLILARCWYISRDFRFHSQPRLIMFQDPSM